MTSFIKSNWALFVSLLLLWSAVYSIYLSNESIYNDSFIYSNKTAYNYIHQDVSELSLNEPAILLDNTTEVKSSQSFLWSFFFAKLSQVGWLSEELPFYLNLLFSSIIMLMCYLAVKRELKYQSFVLLLTLSVVAFSPLPALVYEGIDNLFYIFFTLLYVFLFVLVLTAKRIKINLDSFKFLLLLNLFLPLVRSELLILTFIFSGWLIKRNRYVLSTIFMLIPLITLYLINYAVPPEYILNYSVSFSGFYDISNFTIQSYLLNIRENVNLILNSTPLFTLFVINAFVYLALYNTVEKVAGSYWLSIFMFYTILTAMFLTNEIFVYQESLFFTLGFASIATGLSSLVVELMNQRIYKNYSTRNLVLIFTLGLVLTPFMQRGLDQYNKTIDNTLSNYQDGYMTGKFLDAYYHDMKILCDQPAMIKSFTDVEITSLSIEENTFTNKIENSRLMIVTKLNQSNNIPKGWIRIDTSETEIGDVVFYVSDKKEERRIKNFLNEFGSPE